MLGKIGHGWILPSLSFIGQVVLVQEMNISPLCTGSADVSFRFNTCQHSVADTHRYIHILYTNTQIRTSRISPKPSEKEPLLIN